MLSIDCETTGLDLYHGARPFFVTTCSEDGTQNFWEWPVNPYTRTVEIDEDDAREIRQLLAGQHGGIVGHNIKFDAAMLREAEITDWSPLWELTHDTMIAGHLLASNRPHNLTDMATQYLGVNIQPKEDALEQAVKKAHRVCRSKGFQQSYGVFAIAEEGREDMPSVKGGAWKSDTWLPKEMTKVGFKDDEGTVEGWGTVLAEYANADSAVTLALWKACYQEMRRRGLFEIYQARVKVLRVAYLMEQRGVTANKQRLDQLTKHLSRESQEAGKVCINIAASCDYDLQMPKSGNNASLSEFVFGPLGLPPLKYSEKTGKPGLDKEVIEQYCLTLPHRSKGLCFVKALADKRKRDTALSYMESYKRFWVPLEQWVGTRSGDAPIDTAPLREDGWYVLHPSLNPIGTDTLRWSCSQPNSQNISKQEGFSLRYMFGPAPNREWWSLDAQNIELRIPTFEFGETQLMEVFLHPEKEPYFGSYHLVIFDLLHPEMFKQHGKACKDLFESTWYQWVKNGNFAVLYGAQEAKADATYHVKGAYAKIRYRFPNIAKGADRLKQFADKHGYVETIPDRSVNPDRGYPILCSRTEFGKVMPTVPLNYHTQSTAMWWMGQAMVRCQEQLDSWNEKGEDIHMALQVHDELVFDIPARKEHGNLPKVRRLQALMASCGEDIGVPTPVACEYHRSNWAEGERL